MENKTLARAIVESSAVLLKNDGLLPLPVPSRAAFFGRTQLETVYSGNGSGSVDTYEPVRGFLDECQAAGIEPCPGLAAFYREAVPPQEPETPEPEAFKHALACGLMYEIFGKYHPPKPEPQVPDDLIAEARRFTDTALLFLGRDSGGEECDRRMEGDYTLSDSERELVQKVCGAFPKVALILNINGLVDLSWTEDWPSIKSILYIGVCGQEGGAALARLLTGRISPSGKLAFTVPRRLEDVPSARHFSFNKDDPDSILTYEKYGLDPEKNGSRGFAKSPVTVYHEDILMGYRGFDAMGLRPLYPFGHGLSYTAFAVTPLSAEKTQACLRVTVSVRNTGRVPGRETVQLYVSPRGTASGRAPRALAGFEKTPELAPGETVTVTVPVPWRELACYREADAAWVIEAGLYELFTGGGPDSLSLSAKIRVREDIPLEACENRLGLRPCNRGKFEILQAPHTPLLPEEPGEILLTSADIRPAIKSETAPLPDLSDLTDEELASLCVGYGPGIPFAAIMAVDAPSALAGEDGEPLTVCDHPTGLPGYVSPAMPDRGIHSVFYKDGPSGVGGTAWPTEMLAACSFDRALLYAFGEAIGRECEAQGVNVWLGPAVNLHRHPLGGRNFEYYSEDPFLTAELALAVTRGVQESHPVLVCPKHMAANEQETYRRGSARFRYDAADSILTERTLRELYLRPFERLVREGGTACLMTSFNKINGTFAGGSRDLCTHVLREEWGFDGAVVTDWGDMDTVVDGVDALAAGNDIVMPGGPPVIRQILKGLREGRLTRETLETAAGHLLRLLERADKLQSTAVNV